MSNQCGECRVCCEGWLEAKVLGQTLSPITPCKFINKDLISFGCSIHKDRPIKPCKIFNCLWITQNMPKEFKPSVTKVIPVQNVIDKIPYVFLVNAPNYASEELIDWFMQNQKNKNLVYFNKKDELIVTGSQDFLNSIENIKDSLIQQYFKLNIYYNKE